MPLKTYFCSWKHPSDFFWLSFSSTMTPSTCSFHLHYGEDARPLRAWQEMSLCSMSCLCFRVCPWLEALLTPQQMSQMNLDQTLKYESAPSMLWNVELYRSPVKCSDNIENVKNMLVELLLKCLLLIPYSWIYTFIFVNSFLQCRECYQQCGEKKGGGYHKKYHSKNPFSFQEMALDS